MEESLNKAIVDCFNFHRENGGAAALDTLSQMADEELYLCHFGIGLYIRNTYLTPDSALYRLFYESGVTHKDDMSAIMLKAWCKILRTEVTEAT